MWNVVQPDFSSSERKVKHQYCQTLSKRSTALKVRLVLWLARFMWVSGKCALRPLCERERLQVRLPSRPNTHPSPSRRLPLTSAIWRRVNLHSGVCKQPGSSPKATQPLWSVTGIGISQRGWWTSWRASSSQSQREHAEGFKRGSKSSQISHSAGASLSI